MSVTIVDDSDGRIQYTAETIGNNWSSGTICDHCDSNNSESQVANFAFNGTWHTARGGGRQSNATIDIAASRITASFILFRRRLEENKIAQQARLSLYVDGQRVNSTTITWDRMMTSFGAQSIPSPEDPQFIPNAILFDQAVTPGQHVFTIESDTGGMTERDTSLALDSIQFTSIPTAKPKTDVPTPAGSRPNMGLIIGPIVGGFAFLSCLLFFMWQRRKERLLNRSRDSLNVKMIDDTLPYLEKANWKWNLKGTTVKAVLPPPPSPPISFTTLATLSVFSRPGADLHRLSSSASSSTAERHSSSFKHTSMLSSSLSYTSYEQQWHGIGPVVEGRSSVLSR